KAKQLDDPAEQYVELTQLTKKSWFKRAKKPTIAMVNKLIKDLGKDPVVKTEQKAMAALETLKQQEEAAGEDVKKLDAVKEQYIVMMETYAATKAYDLAKKALSQRDTKIKRLQVGRGMRDWTRGGRGRRGRD